MRYSGSSDIPGDREAVVDRAMNVSSSVLILLSNR